jgi:hypothetical protein
MRKTERILSMFALILFGAGWSLYHLGSQLNLEVGGEQMLWDQAPGDKWLYVGGLMMLISGSLAAAAFRFWRERRKGTAAASLNVLDHHWSIVRGAPSQRAGCLENRTGALRIIRIQSSHLFCGPLRLRVENSLCV